MNHPADPLPLLDALNAISTTLNQAEDVPRALETTLARLVELMGLETGWIFLHDPDAQDRHGGRGFVLAAHHNLPPALALDQLPVWHTGCDCQALCLKGQLTQAYNEVRCSRLAAATGERLGLAVHASAPLRARGQTLGILNVAAAAWDAFTPQTLALFQNVGHQLGAALERARLYDMLQERRIHEQNALLDLSRQLLGRVELDDLMRYLVDEVRQLLQVDASAILLLTSDNQHLRFQATSGWRANPVADGHQVPTAGTGSGQVIRTQQPLVWTDVTQPPGDAPTSTPMLSWVQPEGFRSAAIVPLLVDERAIGTLVIDTRQPRTFNEADIRFLQLMANQAAIAIEKARLRQEELARHRIEQELTFGRDIQLSMLPESCPQVPGWQFTAVYEAARQVGGDFYDHFRLPGDGHRLALVVADVAGKGVPAALFMALSRTTLRNTALRGRPPAEALAWANRFIREDSQSDMFLTAFFGALDTDSGQLTYANAGHNHPLWWHAATGQFSTLSISGIVLGVLDEITLLEETVELAPGDVLLLYTDGITEAVNAQLEEFGERRLQTAVAAALAANPAATTDDLAAAIQAAVRAFTGSLPQYDDLTLLLARRLEPGSTIQQSVFREVPLNTEH
ncbi:MAG: SpoIIE family protein phosphatase [Anaerolineales bacterium]|nr:SpoIIE family protein phosphatase [Anaerolineales bacterium]